MARDTTFWLAALLALSASLIHADISEADHTVDFGIIVVSSAAEARALSQKLKAGMDFAVLAKEKSINPTARDGGYMGRLQISQTRPEFQGALKALKPGEISDVISTSNGFAILTIFSSLPPTQDLGTERLRTLISSGAVRATLDISGMSSANAAFEIYAKTDGWNRDLSKVCAVRTNSYSAAVDRLVRRLPEVEALPAGKVPPLNLLQGHALMALLSV